MLSNFHMNNVPFRFLKLSLLSLLGISLLCCLPFSHSNAQFEITIDKKEKKEEKEWERHMSISNVFESKFPQSYKYKIFPFRYNEEKIAFGVEILSTLDGTVPAKNKSIFIRAVQTFGDPIDLWKAKKILDQEAAIYVRSAKKIGGTILTNENIDHNDFPGKNIYITYYADGKKYGIRIRIYMTNYSRVEQVLTGSAKTLFSYRSDDFFNSLKLYDGITALEEPKKFAEGWTKHTAKNKIFTVKLPPVNSSYTPSPPKFVVKPRKECMKFLFYDPVINETVFYNVYAYKLKKKIDEKLAKHILFSQHIDKYVDNLSIESLNMKNTVKDGVNVMGIRLIIAPPKDKPYLSSLLLEMRYSGDIVVVQEITSSANHTRNGFPDMLYKMLEFHPEKYKEPPASAYTRKK